MKKCKVCDKPTKTSFNINLKLTPICEYCANAIFIQQAQYFTQLPIKNA